VKKTTLTVLFLSMLLLAAILVFSRLPNGSAALSEDTFIEEVTTTPPEVNVVASDSIGRLFLGADNDVYRSVDAGGTWAKVLDGPSGFPTCPWLLFVDSKDYIYSLVTNASAGDSNQLYRSTDHGLTWSKVLSNIPFSIRMSEAPNGDLYLSTYSTDYEDYVYRSIDDGLTWSVFYDLTNVVDHFHDVQVAPNGQVYVSTGDGQYDDTVQRYDWETGQWQMILNETASYETMRISFLFFDDEYVYLMNDASQVSYRMPLNGNGTDDFEAIFDNRFFIQTSNNVYSAVRIGKVYLVGFSEGQVWASWDGEHWTKVYDSGTVDLILSFTTRQHPVYFTCTTTNRLFRLSITQEDIIHLYYSEYNLLRGKVTNAEDYFLEQRIWNGTNYLDFTDLALSDVYVGIKGLSFSNILNQNSGFEWGNKTGWIEEGDPLGEVVSSDKANGTYSYRIVKSTTDRQATAIRQPSSVEVRPGDIAILSFCAKSNTSTSQPVTVAFRNGTTTVKSEIRIMPSTTWMTYTFSYTVRLGTSVLSYSISFPNANQTIWIDSVLFYISQTNVLHGAVGSTNSISYIDRFYHAAIGERASSFEHPRYFNGRLDTSNPTIVFENSTVSYLGTFANGTGLPPTKVNTTLTGAVRVEANIQGSGQAILYITGKRIFHADSVVLQSWKDNVFFGRYFRSFLSAYSTDLIALTNLQSRISSLVREQDNLTLFIDSAVGVSSITKVFVANKGAPFIVDGATTWTYDSQFKIVTIHVENGTSQPIRLRWDDVAPTTSESYDGYWRRNSFYIDLTAQDNLSGVKDTYYRINEGPEQQVGIDGQPFISTEGSNNILEYWSDDEAGNEELPHKILREIKLDMTAPIAEAGVNQTVNEDSLVIFDGTASTDENGIADYTWTFIDLEPHYLVGPKSWYSFMEPSIYAINLEVVDPAGNRAQDTVEVRVLDITKPIANAGQNQTAEVGSKVTFNGSSSTDNVGITSYEWSFGDGTNGTGKITTHSYSVEGTYRVTLTAGDLCGNTDEAEIAVNVRPHDTFPPNPDSEIPTEVIAQRSPLKPVWIIAGATLIVALVTVTGLILKKRM
jgi:photosystem II stability/assembly factor-like uncharacterized protein